VNGDHAIPLRSGDFLDRLHGTILSRIVHQDIDFPKLGRGLVDEALAILFIRDIRADGRRTASRIANFARHRFDFRYCTRPNHHCRTFPGKLQRDGAPDPAPATGNDRNFSVQQHSLLRKEGAG
jgi:hypothetical protein